MLKCGELGFRELLADRKNMVYMSRYSKSWEWIFGNNVQKTNQLYKLNKLDEGKSQHFST